MDSSAQALEAIAAALAAESAEISTGKMMSSPGIRYKDKVFAFAYRDAMVFRLGRGFDPATLGVREYRLLAPFKTKPPLLDWFEVGPAHRQQWEELARVALERMRAARG
jgi:hypothetical protein